MDTEQVHEPITTVLPMRLHLPLPGTFALVTAHLHYTPQQPYAVRAAFHLPPGHEPVVWHLGRDLLRDGLFQRAGEGDVRIGPASRNSPDVRLCLHGDGGVALLTGPRRPLDNFLRRTAEAVPYGREAAVPGFLTGLDTELARILADAC